MPEQSISKKQPASKPGEAWRRVANMQTDASVRCDQFTPEGPLDGVVGFVSPSPAIAERMLVSANTFFMR